MELYHFGAFATKQKGTLQPARAMNTLVRHDTPAFSPSSNAASPGAMRATCSSDSPASLATPGDRHPSA